MKKKSFVAIVLAIVLSLVAFSLSACVGKNGNGSGSSHEHTFSSSWSNDETFHWHAATCGHTEEIRDREAHTFIDDECSKCHYKRPQQQGGESSNPGGDEKTVLRTVTFDTDGGESVNPMQFEVGKLMKDLPTPTRGGYKFIYWCDIFGVKYDATTIMPDSDLTLYAYWQKEVTEYKDEYVTLSPATQGVKNPLIQSQYADEVDVFVYVEITSDDLGGIEKVNTPNNFTLRTMEGMAYKKADGYDWAWYQGDFSTPNGNQRFTLKYGSNIQLVTISDSGTVVRTYLVDIYVRRDFYMNLYSDLTQKEPYTKVRVIEGDRFDSETQEYTTGYAKFEYDKRVYYNTSTRKYEAFTYSTAILSDWNLYQTYKPYEAEVEVGEGTLDEPFTIVPFEKNQILAKPTKTNSEFLGWQTSDGKYFCDVTGDTGDNYYTSSTSKLTAVYADSKLYYHKEIDVEALTQKHVGKKTVPLVTYTDDKKTDICEVVYVPYGEEAIAPQKAPTKDDMLFMGWYYKDKTGGEQRFDFSETVTEPVALYPKFQSASYFNMGTATTKYYAPIPLGIEKDQGSLKNSDGYRAYLPTDGEYTLTVTTTSRVDFTVQAYGTAKASSYTATSSSPRTVTLQLKGTGSVTFADGGYVTITVTSLTGSFATKLTGATAKSSRGLLAEEEALDYGDQVTIKPLYLGYDTASVYNSGQEVSKADYTFNADGEFEYTCNLKITEALVPFEFESNETECKITGIKDKGIDTIVIPDYVTEIAEGAFSGCDNLISITLPFVGDKPHIATDRYQYPFGYIFGTSSYSGGTAKYQEYYGSSTSSTTYTTYYIPTSLKTITITGSGRIPYGAFCSCSNLTSITISANVTSIGEQAFYGCSSLERIDVAPGNTTYSSQDGILYNYAKTAFIYISKAIKGAVTIPEGITSIGDSAFSYRQSLTSITIPASVTSIGTYAFDYCTNLQTVNWNATNCTEAGKYDSSSYPYAYTIFRGCTSLTTVNIGENVQTIPDYAFYGCVATISWGDTPTIKEIGESAFYGYKGTSITIPASVTSIGDSAFSGCSNLTSITIPVSVTSIGSSAFSGCSNLTSITIPASVTSIGSSAFSACNSLEWIDVAPGNRTYSSQDGILYNYAKTAFIYIPKAIKGAVTIPERITAIDDKAFYDCSSLTSITIPASVTSIPASVTSSAFSGCSNLERIDVDPDNKTYSSQDGILYNYAKTEFVDIPEAIKGAVSIPEGITVIGDRAFYGRSSLTSITIPANVTSIGGSAFSGCNTLQMVTVAGDSKLKYICDEAFYNCSNLTEITIPASVISIGDVGSVFSGSGAFERCANLQTVTFAADSKLESIGSNAFYNCSKITSIAIPASVTSIGRSAFSGCTKLRTVTFAAESKLKSIGDDAFLGCSFTEITIPANVTFIGDAAFYNCSKLTEIAIPASVTYIGKQAFFDCTNLQSVTFENSDGWRVSESSNMRNAKDILQTDLQNQSTAAQYLRYTYRYYYWQRSEA